MLSKLLTCLRSAHTWPVFLCLGLLVYFSSTVIASAHYHHRQSAADFHHKEDHHHSHLGSHDCTACQLLVMGQPQPELPESGTPTTVAATLILPASPQKTVIHHLFIRAPPHSFTC